MKIGTLLKVHAVAEPTYDIHNNRNILGRPLDPPEWAWYVGYTFKQEGKYDPGDSTRTFSVFDELPEYEPPSLYTTNTYKVYRIRFHERGRERYCFPEDAGTLEE